MKPTDIFKLHELVADIIAIDEIPCVLGSPGIGKSAMYQKIADEFNLAFIDFRLSMADPIDLMGYPQTDAQGRMYYAASRVFPLDTDTIPDGKNGWLISFEEINSAPKALQAIAYKILHDRMVGDRKLHPNVRMVANGNLETDGAVVEPMSSALASRMVMFHAMINPISWLEWAGATTNTLFHPTIIGYLNFKKESIHNFKPSSKDKSFPCPRTWAKVSKLLTAKPDTPIRSLRTSIEGMIGEATTTDVIAFIDYFDSVPSLSAVVNDPTMHTIPTELGIKYATCIAFANKAAPDTVNALATYFGRSGINEFSPEYFIMFMRLAYRKMPTEFIKALDADVRTKFLSYVKAGS